MEIEKNIRTSLEEDAFPLWVLRRYQEATGRSERSALEYIIERWSVLDSSASVYGATISDFEQDRAQSKVSPIVKRQRPEGETA